MSSQTKWKHGCNRTQRRSNKQLDLTDEDCTKSVDHYSKTRYGDIWNSPNDGWNWKRGKGHDKRKPWKD